MVLQVCIVLVFFLITMFISSSLFLHAVELMQNIYL